MTPRDLLSPLRDSDVKIAVTGATGWFGSVAMELLDDVLGGAAHERVLAFGSRPREVTTPGGRRLPVVATGELAGSLTGPTLVLHFGYRTRDQVATIGSAAFLQDNLRLTGCVLDALGTGHVRGLAITSSGAAKWPLDADAEPYGFGKRLDELVFQRAAADVLVPCAIARVFSVAGRHMTKPEKYALGSLLLAARGGGPIRVNAAHPVFRSYVGVDEVVALLIACLLEGTSILFETAGEPVEVGRLAALAADLHGLDPRCVERPAPATMTEDRYTGNPDVQDALAARFGLECKDLRRLVAETSAGLGELT